MVAEFQAGERRGDAKSQSEVFVVVSMCAAWRRRLYSSPPLWSVARRHLNYLATLRHVSERQRSGREKDVGAAH